MTRKIVKNLSISTLILAGVATNFCSNNVSAAETIEGVRYWDFSEMSEFKTAFDTEMESICAGDYFCRMEELYSRAETDGRYLALDAFSNFRFTATSINPSQETIKLYYNNEDHMSLMHPEYATPRDITELYLVWVESQVGDPEEDVSWLSYGYRYPYLLEGSEAASHVLLDENSDTLGIGWFTPKVERTYSVASGNLADNFTGKIYFSMLTDDGGRSLGAIHYESCLNSPNYEAGMECRLLFGEDATITYYPFAVSAPDDSNTSMTTASGDNSDSTTSNGIGSDDITSSSASATTKSAQSANTNQESTITTPNTGEITTTPNGSTEFPWWLGLIFVIGSATLAWLFWPKSRKSHKKGIDKPARVR